MDIPELERLAETAVAGSPRDLVLARSKFVRLAVRDPQAVFVMSDDVTRLAIAEDWFNTFARHRISPKGAGAVSAAPFANNSPPAITDTPLAGLSSDAGGEPRSDARANARVPETATSQAPAASDPKPSDAAIFRVPATGQTSHAATARPQSVADIRAAGAFARHLARTVFDSFTVRDGRAIGNVRWCELERLRTASAREAAVIHRIQRMGVPASPDDMVRDVIKVSDLERAIQAAAEIADAA